MKRLHKFSAFIAAVALVLATGCVAATSINATADKHGLFTADSKGLVPGDPAGASATGDSTEIASYSVVLGLVDVGHKDYAAKVKTAEAQGKKIRTKTTWYIVVTTTTAYAK
jgi:hypothetical protein